MKMMSKILAVMLMSSAAFAADPEIGKPAPEFSLPTMEGKTADVSSYKGKYVVLEWINHGCPFVKKHYESGNMQSLQKEVTGKDVVWLSVASSAKGKEGYFTAKGWEKLYKEKDMASTAVLLDPDGKVGHLYGAKTTPHMFIINPEGLLIYKGAIDDKRSTDAAEVKTAKNYVRQALDEALAGKPVSEASTEAYGCSVKYKK